MCGADLVVGVSRTRIPGSSLRVRGRRDLVRDQRAGAGLIHAYAGQTLADLRAKQANRKCRAEPQPPPERHTHVPRTALTVPVVARSAGATVGRGRERVDNATGNRVVNAIPKASGVDNQGRDPGSGYGCGHGCGYGYGLCFERECGRGRERGLSGPEKGKPRGERGNSGRRLSPRHRGRLNPTHVGKILTDPGAKRVDRECRASTQPPPRRNTHVPGSGGVATAFESAARDVGPR